MEICLREDQWQRVAHLLGKQGVMGRPRADDRKTLNAILYVLVTDCWWNDLPREYGNFMTA
jgi:transposase